MNKIAQINFSGVSVPQTTTAAFNINDRMLGIGNIISGLLIYVFAFAGAGLLFYLISGGLKLMTAAGDTKKIQEGQQIITNAFVGFFVIFLAFFIVETVANLLG